MEITAVVKGAWDAFATKITLFLPKLIGAIIVFVAGLIIAIIASFDAPGLPVVAAIIVLILGVLFGNLLSASVRTAASNAGLTIAEGLGKASLYAVVIFSTAVALIQLGIGEEIVRSAFGMAFGSLALAFGLAFGIGGKEVAADYLKKWFGGKDPSVQE